MNNKKITKNLNGQICLLLLILILTAVWTYSSKVIIPYSESLGFWDSLGPQNTSTNQIIKYFIMTFPTFVICATLIFIMLKRVNSLRSLNYPLAAIILFISCFFSMQAFGLISDIFIYLFIVPLIIFAISIPAGIFYGLRKDIKSLINNKIT